MLKKVFYNCLMGVSRLPIRVLYFFSDVLFVIGYYVIRYRRSVVTQNIRNSFPDFTEEKIQHTVKQFYRNFSDYIVETAKSFTMTEEELLFRVQHINRKVFEEAHEEKKNIILLAGHVFNWEWINALAKIIPQENCHPVYRKIQSAFWDARLRQIRDNFGNRSIEAEDVLKHIFRNENNGESVYMFVGDQSPQENVIEYGLEFLNQQTPVYMGYDKLATRFDMLFVYCEMKKVKRGFYQVNYYRLEPENDAFVPGEVVKSYYKRLENTIIKDPANYLWSHRRWKHGLKIKKKI